jgi:hypothetical protein
MAGFIREFANAGVSRLAIFDDDVVRLTDLVGVGTFFDRWSIGILDGNRVLGRSKTLHLTAQFHCFLRCECRGEDRVLEIANLVGRIRRNPIRFGLAGLAQPAVELRFSVLEDVVKGVRRRWLG